jgi:deoxyadenosine/deoxycytidine kinase
MYVNVKQMKILSIEGNIGSGKTTLFKALQKEKPDWIFVKEPVDLWTLPLEGDPDKKSMLGHFYDNPKEHAFAFQM